MQHELGAGEFAKYHALGNDYIVIDAQRFGVRLTPTRIRQLCDRHTGVGSDGILALQPSRRGAFGLRVFNPDGSEAEKSGNGARILACFLFDFGYTRQRTVALDTPGGVVPAQLSVTGGRVTAIRVGMGRATFVSSAIPMRGRRRDVVDHPLRVGTRTFRITTVSVGNPHCVIFVPQLRVADLRRFGPLIERHRVFPQRTNVQFARVRSRRLIEALIWERGAGETLASGSSSCAVAAAAFRRGLTESRVTVRMPGGSLAIQVGDHFELQMTGPATPVYRGRMVVATDNHR